MLSFASEKVYLGESDNEVDEDMMDAAADNGLDALVISSAAPPPAPPAAGYSVAMPAAAPLAPPAPQQQQQQQAPPQPPYRRFMFRRPAASAPQPRKGKFARKREKKRAKMAREAPAAEEKAQAQPRRVRRKVDTNVLAVGGFAQLPRQPDDFWAGDAIFCEACSAAVSQLSEVGAPAAGEAEAKVGGGGGDGDDEPAVVLLPGQRLWRCEFCGHANAIDADEEELPGKDDELRNYILEPAPAADEAGAAAGEAPSLVLVVDTSGSMAVTQEVSGRIELRGAARDEIDLSMFPPAEAAALRREQANRRRVTHVSRLQAVQAAIDRQLERAALERPDTRVKLVTFASDIQVHGDASEAQPAAVAGDKLGSMEQLQAIGTRHAPGGRAVSESRGDLSSRVSKLQEGGQTALGPAMVVAVAMASGAAGSKVVLCTDGLANVGVGALEGVPAEGPDREAAERWYEGVGNLARLSGVTVSVTSITGQECSLENLGRVAEATGGVVDRVDPSQIAAGGGFGQLPSVATNVEVTVVLHRDLRFRNEEAADGVRGNTLRRSLGGVDVESEVTVEFGVAPERERAHAGLGRLPFQLQVRYTTLDGLRGLRVVSRYLDTTKDRAEAEEHAQADLLAANVVQQSARLARRGSFQAAQAHNILSAQMLARVAAKQYESPAASNQWVSNVARDLDNINRLAAENDSDYSASSSSEGESDDGDDDVVDDELMAPGAAPPAPGAARGARRGRGGARGRMQRARRNSRSPARAKQAKAKSAVRSKPKSKAWGGRARLLDAEYNVVAQSARTSSSAYAPLPPQAPKAAAQGREQAAQSPAAPQSRGLFQSFLASFGGGGGGGSGSQEE